MAKTPTQKLVISTLKEAGFEQGGKRLAPGVYKDGFSITVAPDGAIIVGHHGSGHESMAAKDKYEQALKTLFTTRRESRCGRGDNALVVYPSKH